MKRKPRARVRDDMGAVWNIHNEQAGDALAYLTALLKKANPLAKTIDLTAVFHDEHYGDVLGSAIVTARVQREFDRSWKTL